MSGRNQHHFWQALQRGFGIKRKSNYYSIFAYHKAKAPIYVGTRNIGAMRDFFDLEPGKGADDLITATESELEGLVKHLQGMGTIEDSLNT